MAVIRAARALARPPAAAYADAAKAELLDRATSPVVSELEWLLGERQVLGRPVDLVRYAADASPYRLVPQAVVVPRHAADVGLLFAWARRSGHGLTFRAAGTSLNGQAQSDDVLVDVREHFAGARVLDGGARLAARPGTIPGRANALLAPYGRKLGPDPASAAAATIGGVVAGNASGMTCGVAHNAYHTLASATVVLASGTVVDTGAPDADERLRRDEPQLCAELRAIKADIEADAPLVARLRRKFSIKNTSGYRLDAFLDADTPAGILQRLVVGSEGTLGFVADTVWETVPVGRRHTTAVLRFPTLRAAASAVPALAAAGADAVELLDAASVRAAAGIGGAPAWFAALGPDAGDAAVLTERRSDDPAELAAFEAAVTAAVGEQVAAGAFTRDDATAAGWWATRAGLLAIIGAARPAGTSLITEDVCVPPESFADLCEDLEALLETHGFLGAVNGHASAGNAHFYLYLDASSAGQVATYRAVMEDLVDLICDRYEGSLKAEHGTGRAMTPYLAREWGATAVEHMWRLKRALDPAGILGPGVILNTDPEVTFTGLKSLPPVAADLDPCIECGYCEPVCPSRHLAVTPRQRIALHREMARQGWHGPLEQALEEAYPDAAVRTCATDSACAIACPVDVDTGQAMIRVRHDARSPAAQRIGELTARYWGPLITGARLGIVVADISRRLVGDAGLRAATDAVRAVVGPDRFPRWMPELPRAARRVRSTCRQGADALLFASCVNRIFGASRAAPDDVGVTEALVSLAERAGRHLWVPADLGGICCGDVWGHKGLGQAHAWMAARVTEDLFRWSDGGRLPIVVDAASCTLGLTRQVPADLDEAHRARHARLTIVDAVTWTLEQVVPALPGHGKARLAAVHPNCSLRTLGLEGQLLALTGEVAEGVVCPITATCCATAGDRAFFRPELTESATAEEADELRSVPAELYLSGNRTCELGLEHDTGYPYESVVVALERLSRAGT